MFRRLLLAGLAVLANLLLTCAACAQDYLNFPPSPEANGRGGIYFSGDTDDPLAPLSNPALLGLMAERNHLMAGFYLKPAVWGNNRPNYDTYSGSEYSIYTAYLGYNRAALWHSHFSLGFGYQQVTYEPNSRQSLTKGISAGIALHIREAELAAGFNFRSDGHGINPFDIGVFGQLFADRAFFEKDLTYSRDGMLPRPFGTVSMSYAMRNLGPASVPVPNDVGDRFLSPLPRRATLGVALQTGIHCAHPLADDWQILSFATGIEAEDNLVEGGRWGGPYRYRGLLGRINLGTNLILGEADSTSGLKKGFEVGIAEAVFFRWGYVQDDEWYIGGNHTNGLGVHLSGLLKVATLSEKVRANRISGYIARHVDIQYNQSVRHDRPLSEYDGVTYRELALLFKY